MVKVTKEYEILKNADKVVLAYSGGLDTSVLVSWLKEQGVKEVICVSGDLGQVEDPKALEEKALTTGASKFYNCEISEEYIKDYAFKALKAGAKYEGVYLLGTATARPLIAKKLVEIAHKEDCKIIVHGCTGKGNDQVRFELSIYAEDPEIEVIAPWRFWDIESRTEEIEYAQAHNIPIPVSKENDYSMDENIWHLSHEGQDLENTENQANLEKVLDWCNTPQEAPDQAEIISIGFEQGIPVSLNGEEMDGVSLVTALNKIGAKHGIGIDDIVESRLVGMKSRGIYENPAGSILYYAHEKLESITLDADTLHFKQPLSYKYAELVYNGKWSHPLKEALDAFVDKTQEFVSGTVKVQLYKGGMQPAGLSSPYSLYDEGYATFEADDVYNQNDATGFINLYGLSTKIWSQSQKSKK